MGVISKVFKTVKSFISAPKVKAPAYVAPKIDNTAVKAAEDRAAAAEAETLAAEEEQKKKNAALLAQNAGGQGATLGDPTAASVTRKNLLGL